MFSTDKNIETIAQLVESLKDYVKLEKELLQLNMVKKIVQLLTALVLTIVLAFFLLLVIIFGSFSVGFALTSYMSAGWAFLIITGFYMMLFFLMIINRKRWFERPLVNLFSNILTEQ